jgi:hypothetical protein
MSLPRAGFALLLAAVAALVVSWLIRTDEFKVAVHEGACDKFASPSGSDANVGTLAAPYATVGKLLDSLASGQTGCFRTGTYTFEDAEVITTAGLTLRPYNGEQVVLRGPLRVRPDGAGTIIEGFTLDGYTPRAESTLHHGPSINANDVVLRDNEITNHHNGICIQVAQYYSGPRPENVTIERNRIHDCGVLPSTNHHHGIYISAGLGTVVRDNWIYDNVDRGVQLYPDADETLVTGNIIDGNGEGLNFSCDDTNCSQRNIAEGNVISNSDDRWNVSAISQGTEGDGSNVLRRNCMFAANQDSFYNQNGGINSDSEFFTEPGGADANLIGVDPGFSDRDANDFHLQGDSPCLAVYAGTMSLP